MKRAKKQKTRRRTGRELSRREFLARTTAAGVALGLPGFLSGCGSDDDGGVPPATATPTAAPTATPTPGTRPRELGELHFDFSSLFAGLTNLRLFALGSRLHQVLLSLHTPETRALARERIPALLQVEDAVLTHFIENVDLPSDALQALWVTGTVAATGEPAVAALKLHIPQAVAQVMGDFAQAAGRGPGRSAKARAYGLGGGSGLVQEALDALVTPFDTAAWLVFNQQEILNLDPGQGASICELISSWPCSDADTSCEPFLNALALQIAQKGPATPSGGWATLVPVTDENGDPLYKTDADGNPVLDADGNRVLVYQWDLDEEVAQTAVGVGGQIKKAIFNDAQYAGTNWHPTEGVTTQDGAASGSRAAAMLGGQGAQTTDIAVTGSHPAGTTVHGVNFDTISVIDQGNRTVQIELRNRFLRYVSAFVQFSDEAGNLVPLGRDATQFDTTRAGFLTWLTSNYTILGIPLLGDDVLLGKFQFDVPPDASIAQVYLGSLGVGGEAFSPEAITGSILTLTFNLGLPTMLLILGAIPNKSLQDQIVIFLSTVAGKKIVVQLLEDVIGGTDPEIVGNGLFGTGNSRNGAVGALANIGNALLKKLLSQKAAVAILEALGQDIAEDEALDSAGPLGLVFRLITLAANLSALAQSIGEVLSSPAIFTNTIRLTQTTTVTINHDPNDFRFPATATTWDVRLIYDQASKVVHRQSGPIDPPGQRVDPIVVAFEGLPSGGTVSVDVYLTTESDCIVGRSMDVEGNVGPVSFPGDQKSIDITIKELLIPLTQTTQYEHVLKLEYDAETGQHVWVETDAPTATQADLCQGQDDQLCSLTAITMNQRTGMAGYAYEAGGQGLPFCDGAPESIMHVFQNVFLAVDPDRGLKELACGFQQPASIVYEKLGTATGRHFFLQPVNEGGVTDFLLQSVVLDDTTPFDLINPLAWGAFTQAQDSLAVVPTGYVVGVNRDTHKMEILELPGSAVDRDEAPQAVPFTVQKMGLGTRAGLMDGPVAVRAFGATILILEDGNKRIQAVDVSGNPVLVFQNGTSSIAELVDQDAGTAYLDLGVEGKGYMYVLSYVNGGTVVEDYRLDIYTPQGNFLVRTTGVAAARLAVDTFRNVYTLNYETIVGTPRIEPSLSQWEPLTPEGCPTPPPLPTPTATP